MMFLTWVLLLAWLPLSIMALVFVIRPSRRWPLFGTRGRSLLMLVALFFGMPLLGSLVQPASTRAGPDKSSAAATPQVAGGGGQEGLDHPEYYLELSGVKLAKGPGGAVLLSATITSAAEVPLKNPTVECYLSKGDKDAGTVKGVTNKTIPGGKSIRLVGLNLGAAKGSWNHNVCKITGAEAVKAD